MKSEKVKVTYPSKNFILDAAIRAEDENMIVELLRAFLIDKE